MMNQRKLYENWFNESAIIDRRYRRLAMASLVLALGALLLYFLSN